MELAREAWQENIARCCRTLTSAVGVDHIRELAQTIAKVVGYRGWCVCSTPRSRTARRVNCSTSRARISLAGITKFHWRQGRKNNSGSLRIVLNGSGVTRFTSGRFRRRGADHASSSPRFHCGKRPGNLLGQRLNCPAQGYWFVPGAGVQRRNAETAPLHAWTQYGTGVRPPLAAGTRFMASGTL